MRDFLDSATGTVVLGLALMRVQMLRWRESIRWRFRCGLAFAFGLLAVGVRDIFASMPAGSVDLMLENLGDPFALFLGACMLVLAGIGFMYTVLSAKLVASL